MGRRLAERLTWDKPRMPSDLDVFKWVCRKLWVEVFRKPADKLQTNNKVSGEGGGRERERVREAEEEGAVCATAAYHHPSPDCRHHSPFLSHFLQGVYLLLDYAFKWTQYVSPPAPGGGGAGAASGGGAAGGEAADAASAGGGAGSDDATTRPAVLPYLVFPCGLLRGALTALDMPCTVHVDAANLPRVEFQVRLKEA